MTAKWSPSVQPKLIESLAKARESGHEWVEPEHLVWVDLKEEAGLTAQVASASKVPISKARELLDGRLRRMPISGEGTRVKSKYSPRLQELINSAVQSAGLTREDVEWSSIIATILKHASDELALSLREIGLDASLADAARDVPRQLAIAGLPPLSAGDPLSQYCRDLTRLAELGKINLVIGRDREILELLTILSQLVTNNPVLLGEPGVGKTAIVEGLALKVHAGEVPSLIGKRVLALDLGAMLAGASYRGEFEDRLKKVIDAVTKAEGRIILFVDEIHTLMGAGKSGEGPDAANLLKPPLARGELRMIGATTYSEYRQYLEKDAAFTRRFQRIAIPEPTPAQALGILRGIQQRYADHHGVEYEDSALEAIVTLAQRYVGGAQFPDKAIKILDRAGAKSAVTRSKTLPGRQRLGTEHIAAVVAEMANIPVSRILQKDHELLPRIAESMRHRIVGQGPAIDRLLQGLRVSLSMSGRTRPQAVLALTGPSGVGKTATALILASELYPGDQQLVRLDMGSFSESHSVSRLVGPPPGYVGYEEGGQLTERVRWSPYSLVLLDGADKAHPDVLRVFTRVFDEGILTASKGMAVTFRHCIFVLTCRDDNGLPREILDRLDDVIRFSPLDTSVAPALAERFLASFARDIVSPVGDAGQRKPPTFRLTPSAAAMATEAFDPQVGAPSIRSHVQHDMLWPLAQSQILTEETREREIVVDFQDGCYIITGT